MKNLQKKRGSQAGVTWHARPRGRATRTRAAPTWRDIHIYIYLSYIIRFFSLPYMGRVITLQIVRSYKPDDLFLFFQCGTNPHYSYLSGNVARRGASDRQIAEYRTVDRMCLGPSIGIIARGLNPNIITAMIDATWRHHAHRSGGHAAHGSRIKHMPILKRYNGPD